MNNLEYASNAYNWYEKHDKHVEKLLSVAKNSVKPSREDLNHPELWKPMHWKWFFENFSMK